MVMKQLGVIILAAGVGKRMRSSHAKVLHILGGKPLIAHPLRTVKALGADRIVVVVGHQAEEVQQACGDGVLFARQKELLGTGHAVLAAENFFTDFSGDILILYGDVPFLTSATLQRLLHRHRDTGATLSLLTALLEDPTGYGRIIRHRDGHIVRIVEEADASDQEKTVREVNPGIYCVRHDFLFPTLRQLDKTNAQREYYVTDIVSRAVATGALIHLQVMAEGEEILGINSREDLAAMEQMLRRKIAQKWMASGVTLEDPDTAYIDEDVIIGTDTVIGPNTHLKGRTVVGEHCRIDGNSFIQNSRIGDRVHIQFSVVICDSDIADDCVIGPFAHLRSANRLARGTVIGNFVEAKNAVMGEGTKAKHLSYLGDVEVGEHTNIGAGTITCNYDGFRKHRTTIGNRVEIGSDTQLVAPVTVGDDAYIGAGTTVTEDVPPGALALSRSPQKHITGWVAARREREKRKTENAETRKSQVASRKSGRKP